MHRKIRYLLLATAFSVVPVFASAQYPSAAAGDPVQVMAALTIAQHARHNAPTTRVAVAELPVVDVPEILTTGEPAAAEPAQTADEPITGVAVPEEPAVEFQSSASAVLSAGVAVAVEQVFASAQGMATTASSGVAVAGEQVLMTVQYLAESASAGVSMAVERFAEAGDELSATPPVTGVAVAVTPIVEITNTPVNDAPVTGIAVAQEPTVEVTEFAGNAPSNDVAAAEPVASSPEAVPMYACDADTAQAFASAEEEADEDIVNTELATDEETDAAAIVQTAQDAAPSAPVTGLAVPVEPNVEVTQDFVAPASGAAIVQVAEAKLDDMNGKLVMDQNGELAGKITGVNDAAASAEIELKDGRFIVLMADALTDMGNGLVEADLGALGLIAAPDQPATQNY